MKIRRTAALLLSACLLLPSAAALSGCSGSDEIILRIYNWEEYIDEGGEGSYLYDYEIDENAPSVLDDFCAWYEEEYGTPIRVEYSTFGTNEDLYNQLKLGDTYDLVCPSDYMIMKLMAEDMLEPFTEDFFDESDENNYYINNVSSYIEGIFENNSVTITSEDGSRSEHSWSEYAAGYMWGTTGFIYNPEYVDEAELDGWDTMLDTAFANKVTTKDNVRDTYFVGLAILYRDELLALQERNAAGELDDDAYNAAITELLNRTDEETVARVQEILLEMKSNIYGFETDTGKNDMVTGKIWINFAWSGDAVYAMDLAEYPESEEEEPAYFNYYVPEECANLWFDGWAMPKGANRQAAQAFINYLSMPHTAVRNMYYIGYTSVIAGDEVLAYVEDTYGVEEGDEEDAVEYDVSYFFGEGTTILTYEDQLSRQLYAQYPTEEVMHRCAVMDYFADEAGERINELWTQIKGETLDAWAIVVICVAVLVIALAVIYVKLGAKVDFFRLKPKKGYKKIKEEPVPFTVK